MGSSGPGERLGFPVDIEGRKSIFSPRLRKRKGELFSEKGNRSSRTINAPWRSKEEERPT